MHLSILSVVQIYRIVDQVDLSTVKFVKLRIALYRSAPFTRESMRDDKRVKLACLAAEIGASVLSFSSSK